MDAVQAPGAGTERDRLGRDPELDELPGRDDPMLAGGQRRNGPIQRERAGSTSTACVFAPRSP
jgi:hypothetical protein